ncbi:MAG: hypothetical protein U0169_25915 [Polyangiaceae bacterium]
MRTLVLSSILAACLAACGGGAPEPKQPEAPKADVPAPPAVPAVPPTPAPSATTAAAPAAPETVWRHEFTKDQAVEFMKARVLPPMSKVFHDYDPKQFAEVTCKTCHGPKYQEPKDFLPKLKLKNGALDIPKKDQAMAKFMGEKVVPAMADAMGMKPYDPKTHEGFGCGGCHTIEK